MKIIVLILLAALKVMAVQSQEALRIGAQMPMADLKMKDISGNLVSLNEAKKSNGLLVMFSCNTCPYVARNQSRTNAICEYALQKEIGVILLNSNEATREEGESYPDMQAYAKQQQYRWYYAVDSHNELANAFTATRTPECYLFDKEGKLVYHGAIDNSPADIKQVSRTHLKEAINEMLAGKIVSVKETRSVGCTIQRKE